MKLIKFLFLTRGAQVNWGAKCQSCISCVPSIFDAYQDEVYFPDFAFIAEKASLLKSTPKYPFGIWTIWCAYSREKNQEKSLSHLSGTLVTSTLVRHYNHCH